MTVARFWAIFFMFWPAVAIIVCLIAPQMNWWFPGESFSPLGERIDDLFYLVLVITTITFIGTHIALGYALWSAAVKTDEKAHFTHGNHNLEVIWTIVPAGILLFIALYQMDVWAEFRIQKNFPEEAVAQPIAEVKARQFECRIRYPGLDTDGNPKRLQHDPQPDDLYAVNELFVPLARPVLINLITEDVQHSFFVPLLRVKQDAVPNLTIPVWFEVKQSGEYELVCAELCGWGHYKMKGRVIAGTETQYREYLKRLHQEQFDDGVTKPEQVVGSR